MAQNTHPHAGQPVLHVGKPLDQARAALILMHGRGSNAREMLSLAAELPHDGFAYLAPQAANNTWYPYPFMQPIERNEPYLSSALKIVGEVIDQTTAAGIPYERVMLLGFSQGACLTLEYAARNAKRYGGIVGLSGGVIGPDGTPRHDAGSMTSTPVFVGCSDVDPHIPKQRVHDTAAIFRALGAAVTERIYPGMGHTINADEIMFVRELMAVVAGVSA